MFSRSLFHHRPSAIVRAIALCALLLIAALAMTKAGATRPIRNPQSAIRNLSFEDRVAAQRAIEAVYHRHRLWPTDKCAAQTSARRSSARSGAAREGRRLPAPIARARTLAGTGDHG